MKSINFSENPTRMIFSEKLNCLRMTAGQLTWIVMLAALIQVLLFCSTSAWAEDGRRGLSQSDGIPIVISQSGSYVLTSNIRSSQINVSAIQITCNDVSLDMNGFSIIGPNNTSDAYSCGIEGIGRDTIAVKNGRIWGFVYGLYLMAVESGLYDAEYDVNENVRSGHLIDHMQTPNNSYGMKISGGVVSNCTSSNNTLEGFFILQGVIENCVANNNGYYGIHSEHSSVRFCTTNKNNNEGISAVGSSLIGCISNYNDSCGIYVNRCTLSNCTVSFTNGNGIWAYTSIMNSCSTVGNSGQGIVDYYGLTTGCLSTYD